MGVQHLLDSLDRRFVRHPDIESVQRCSIVRRQRLADEVECLFESTDLREQRLSGNAFDGGNLGDCRLSTGNQEDCQDIQRARQCHDLSFRELR